MVVKPEYHIQFLQRDPATWNDLSGTTHLGSGQVWFRVLVSLPTHVHSHLLESKGHDIKGRLTQLISNYLYTHWVPGALQDSWCVPRNVVKGGRRLGREQVRARTSAYLEQRAIKLGRRQIGKVGLIGTLEEEACPLSLHSISFKRQPFENRMWHKEYSRWN